MKKRYKKKKRSSVQLTGVVDHVKKRFCFVTVDGMTEDIKVRVQNMNGAIHEDSVELHLINNFSSKMRENYLSSQELLKTIKILLFLFQTTKKFILTFLSKKEIQKNLVIKKSTWQRSQVGLVEKNHLPK